MNWHAFMDPYATKYIMWALKIRNSNGAACEYEAAVACFITLRSSVDGIRESYNIFGANQKRQHNPATWLDKSSFAHHPSVSVRQFLGRAMIFIPFGILNKHLTWSERLTYKDAILTLTVISRTFILLFVYQLCFVSILITESMYTNSSISFSSSMYYRNSQFLVPVSRWSYILVFIICSIIIVIKFTLHFTVKISHSTKINADSYY